MRIKPVLLFLFLFLPVWTYGTNPVSGNTGPAGMSIPDLEKISKERRDTALFYNLGILYSNAGNTGKAVLNFRKALLLRPSDKEAEANLNSLRQSIGIPPYFSDSSPIEKAVLSPFLIFSLNGSLVFGLVFFILGSTGLSLFLSGLSDRVPFTRPDIIRTISVVVLIIGSVYILSSIIRYRFTFDPRNAVVLKDTKLLEMPDSGSLSLADIPGGMECVVRDGRNGYFRVSTIDGREGWIVNTDMERLWEGEK